MKKLILTCLAVGLLASAQAQLFSPESTSGALLGGLIGGAVAGRHHVGEGIAIGAGSGFLLGTLAHEDAVNRSYYSGGYYAGYYPSYSYYPSFSYYGYPRGYYGGRHGYGWRSGYGFSVGWSPGYYYAPAPAYYAPTYYGAAPTPVAAEPPPQSPAPTTPPPAPANNSISAMSGANALFGR